MNDKEKMKRYRRLISCLIAQSLGYFTPQAAVRAIEYYQANKGFCCEWYYDIALKTGKKNVDLEHELIEINKELIHDCYKRRKLWMHNSDYRRARRIVEYNIEGHESVGAAWF